MNVVNLDIPDVKLITLDVLMMGGVFFSRVIIISNMLRRA